MSVTQAHQLTRIFWFLLFPNRTNCRRRLERQPISANRPLPFNSSNEKNEESDDKDEENNKEEQTVQMRVKFNPTASNAPSS